MSNNVEEKEIKKKMHYDDDEDNGVEEIINDSATNKHILHSSIMLNETLHQLISLILICLLEALISDYML